MAPPPRLHVTPLPRGHAATTHDHHAALHVGNGRRHLEWTRVRPWLKVKAGARQAPGNGAAGPRFWRWFKKVELQPESGSVEVFTRPVHWGLLSLQAIAGYKSHTGSFNFRWKVSSKAW